MAADDDNLEELRVLTACWDDARREALLAAYAALREDGRTHEVALMLALGEMLP